MNSLSLEVVSSNVSKDSNDSNLVHGSEAVVINLTRSIFAIFAFPKETLH